MAPSSCSRVHVWDETKYMQRSSESIHTSASDKRYIDCIYILHIDNTL